MQNTYNYTNEEDFNTFFSTEEKCLSYLSDQKWGDKSFICRHCGHDNFSKAKRPFGRRCTRCKHEESAQVGTLFEGCRFPLPKAFAIAHAVCNSPDISTHELARQLDLRQMTCWNFKQKLLDCIKKRFDLSIEQRINLRSIILQ